MVFILFCILVDRPMGVGAIAPPRRPLPPGYVTVQNGEFCLYVDGKRIMNE